MKIIFCKLIESRNTIIITITSDEF